MIQRHKIEYGTQVYHRRLNYLKRKESSYLRRLTFPTELPLPLEVISEAFLEASFCNILLEGPKSLTIEYYKKAMQYFVAYFKKALNDGKEVLIEIGAESIPIMGQKDTKAVTIPGWSNALVLAILLRDQKAIDYFFSINLELLENNMGSWESIWPPVYQMMYHIFHDQSGDIELIMKNLETGANDDISYIIGHDRTKRIPHVNKGRLRVKQIWIYPSYKLFYLAFLKDESGFNELLESYLISFKEMIINDKTNNKWKSWIDRSSLAACAYAYDQGIKITVESDYIPKWLYEGNWEEEV